MSIGRKTCILILTAVLLALTSCGGLVLDWDLYDTKAVACRMESVSETGLKLLTLHYKSEFEQYYKSLLGNAFWDAEIQDGITYETYVREYYVLAEAKALVVLNAMYEREGEPLTKSEQEEIRREAEKVYRGMTAEERLYTGATQDSILELKQAYYIADKMIDLLLSGQKIEVSDEQSRVADISVIRLGSRETADQVYARLLSGENFMSLANECSLDAEISYSVQKGKLAEPLNDIVFSMSAGSTSSVLEANGYFYIIRLTSSYNKLLSMKNKANQLAEARYEGWKSVYDDFAAENGVYVSERCRTIIDLKNDTFSTAFNLFP